MEHKVSIIDTILKNQKVEEIDSSSKNKLVITPEVFFDKHCKPDEFKDLLSKLTKRELQGLEFIFNLMHESKSFNVSPFESFDKNGQPYIWVEIKNKLTSSGLKVRTAGKMWYLIGLYGMGFVTFQCQLEDLYHYLYKS